MRHTAAFRILTLILILGNLESVTVVNHHPDEEYFLEHEVLYEDAIAEAKKLEIYPGIKHTDYILDTKSVTSSPLSDFILRLVYKASLRSTEIYLSFIQE